MVCMRCVRWSLTVKHKTKRKAVSSKLLVHFEAGGRDLPIPDCYSRWNLGPSFWTWDKVNPWNDTILNLPGKKNLSVGKGMISLLGLWRSDSCGCDAERADSRLVMPTSGCWQKAGSISKGLGLTRIQQQSCLGVTVQGCTQVWRLRNHHGIWLNSVTPSTLQPSSSTPRFPPVWSPERCNPWYEVWDWWLYDSCSENLATWAGEAMIQTMHTHTLVSCWHTATEVDGCFVEMYVESNHHSSYCEIFVI